MGVYFKIFDERIYVSFTYLLEESLQSALSWVDYSFETRIISNEVLYNGILLKPLTDKFFLEAGAEDLFLRDYWANDNESYCIRIRCALQNDLGLNLNDVFDFVEDNKDIPRIKLLDLFLNKYGNVKDQLSGLVNVLNLDYFMACSTELKMSDLYLYNISVDVEDDELSYFEFFIKMPWKLFIEYVAKNNRVEFRKKAPLYVDYNDFVEWTKTFYETGEGSELKEHLSISTFSIVPTPSNKIGYIIEDRFPVVSLIVEDDEFIEELLDRGFKSVSARLLQEFNFIRYERRVMNGEKVVVFKFRLTYNHYIRYKRLFFKELIEGMHLIGVD